MIRSAPTKQCEGNSIRGWVWPVICLFSDSNLSSSVIRFLGIQHWLMLNWAGLDFFWNHQATRQPNLATGINPIINYNDYTTVYSYFNTLQTPKTWGLLLVYHSSCLAMPQVSVPGNPEPLPVTWGEIVALSESVGSLARPNCVNDSRLWGAWGGHTIGVSKVSISNYEFRKLFWTVSGLNYELMYRAFSAISFRACPAGVADNMSAGPGTFRSQVWSVAMAFTGLKACQTKHPKTESFLEHEKRSEVHRKSMLGGCEMCD